MLRHLSVQNYAIIESLEVDWCAGVNIITGETGAGKSILLGALALLLGERADPKVLYRTDTKCVIEAEFDSAPDTQAILAAQEIDYEPTTIIRREIAVTGKSRAFINDTPVNLAVIKAMCEKLVNMHSQHETLELIEAGFQIEVLDSLAKNQKPVTEYQELYSQYKEDKLALASITAAYAAAKAELDYLQYQYTELEEVHLDPEEQSLLESELQTLENVERIKMVLQQSLMLIQENDNAAIQQIREAQAQLRSLKNVHSGITNLQERMASTLVEIKDLAAEMEAIQERTTHDPARLDEVNMRLNTLYRLQKKYNLATGSELIALKQSLYDRIQSYDHSATAIDQLQAKILVVEKKLCTLADGLHTNRSKAIAPFEKGVETSLRQVGMPNATFKVDLLAASNKSLSSTGYSMVKFLFSANKGYAPQEIKEVASGGELSRLMLCIKSQVANADRLPTMIFDEIDAGISGEVALRVGEIMRAMSKGHQIICITHLPQMARIADRHFYIYKEVYNDTTNTRIKVLEGEARITEIAKMLGGDKISEAALANAKELLK
jgi:DNA repair protein RecN (Recombination protein N)